jgi:hypothetical protein
MTFQLEDGQVNSAAKAHVDTKEEMKTQFDNFRNNTLPNALASSPNGNLTGLQGTYNQIVNSLERDVNQRIDELRTVMIGSAADQTEQDSTADRSFGAVGGFLG